MLCKLQLFLTVSYVLKSVNLQQPLKPPIVELNHGGSIEGTYFYSTQGNPIDAFLGVPYAQPPLGSLRFADPVPANSWSGILQAKAAPSVCLQIDILNPTGPVFGSEDCLYLNVYTPRDRDNEAVLPVMVYFHGGAYYFGGSNFVSYGPERLVGRRIVLVTVNYRLGPLGFFSTMNSFSPGNYGLKDQNLALKWVQEHISDFGGNPSEVTIFGQSAGGASVSFHMIAPDSSGLFHKAILQSGNYFNPWAIIPESKAIFRARQLAHFLTCPVPIGESYTEMMACLRAVDASIITKAQLGFFIFPTGEPSTIFGPVIEPKSSNSFIDTHPKDITSSYGDEVPVIIGCTSEEGAFKSGPIINRYKNEFIQNFDAILPSAIGYDVLSIQEQQEITNNIKNYYFKNGLVFSKNNHRNLTNVFSDIAFFAGMEQFLRKRRKTASADTFAYIFNHNPPISSSETYGGGTTFYGVSHEDELPFLFPFRQLGLINSRRDLQMVSTMTRMWTDFAKKGDPTPHNSPVKQRWQKVKGFPYRYALIGSKYVRKGCHKCDSHTREEQEEEAVIDAIPDLENDNQDFNRTKRYADKLESAEENFSEDERSASSCRSSKKANCENRAELGRLKEENSTTDDKTYLKKSSRKYNRCYVYSKRSSSCYILQNKSNRFWSGFYYLNDGR